MNINYANVYAVSESDYDLMTAQAAEAASGRMDVGPIVEFSDDFDAVGWYMERMSGEDWDYYHDDL